MPAGDLYEVRRSVRVGAAPAQVREHLVDFHAWRAWSPWEDLDPTMQRTYDGPRAGVGATYSWRGNRRAGAGTMVVTEVAEDRVVIHLVFTRPFRATHTSTFLLRPSAAGGTEVDWVMTGRRTMATRVMEVFTSMDRMMGPDFERGLARLRDVAGKAG